MIFQNPVSQVSPPSLPVAALEFELGPSDILVQGLRPRACCERMEHPMASPCEKRNAPLKLSLSAVACTKSNTIQNMLTLHVATIHMNSFKFGISGLQNKGLKVFLSDSCPKEPQGATPWGASFYWKHVIPHCITLLSIYLAENEETYPTKRETMRRKIINCLASTFSKPWVTWRIENKPSAWCVNQWGYPLHPGISHEISCEDHIMASWNWKACISTQVISPNQLFKSAHHFQTSRNPNWWFLGQFFVVFGGGYRHKTPIL